MTDLHLTLVASLQLIVQLKTFTLATLFKQRNVILDPLLEDMKERKCCVFKVSEYIS